MALKVGASLSEVPRLVKVMDWSDGPVSVLVGDVRKRLADLPDKSVQCVVTSPPYWGLRDYKADGQLGLEATPELYVELLTGIFNEVRRTLRPDGTVWLNLGDSYAGSWGAQSRGNHTGDDKTTLNGHEGGLRLSGRQIEAAPHYPSGTGSLKKTPGLKPKDLIGIPWRVALALQASGWYLRSDIIWSKPNPMPESVTDRPTKAHEYLFLLTDSERYYYDAEAIREAEAPATAERYEYDFKDRYADVADAKGYRGAFGGKDPKWRKSKKPDGWDTGDGAHGTIHRDGREAGEPGLIRDGRNKRTVWTIPTQPYPEAHFATFPEALVEPCIRAGSREGDLVLDPFAGSGTTLAVARRLGRRAVGIELQPDYLPLIQRRVRESALPLVEVMEGGPLS